MINDEISNKALTIEARIDKATAKEILKILQKIMKGSKKIGGVDKLIKFKGHIVR